MSKKVLIYIAGPYRGKNAWQVEQNIRRAEEAGFMLAGLGAIPVIPHTMYRFWDGTLDDDFWLNATMEIMRRCDVVFMLRGWSNSKGAAAEMMEAERIGIPILFEHDESATESVLILTGKQ